MYGKNSVLLLLGAAGIETAVGDDEEEHDQDSGSAHRTTDYLGDLLEIVVAGNRLRGRPFRKLMLVRCRED